MADTIELRTLGSVIKETYEDNPDTNAYTDDEKSKLAGIESNATRNSSDLDLLDRSKHTGYQAIETISGLNDAMDAKVDKVTGKELSDNNFTNDEKTKLSGLEGPHFRGTHVSLTALQAAVLDAVAGDYADVDGGVGEETFRCIWDVSNSAWVPQLGESTQLTGSQVKSLYESQPDTNAFTDAEKLKLLNISTTSDRFSWKRLGTWNAATNTPSLQDGTGNSGDFYVVTNSGSRDFGSGVTRFVERDWVVYSGGTWQRLTLADHPVEWASVLNKPVIPPHQGSIGPAVASCLVRLTANQATVNDFHHEIRWGATTYDPFSIWNGNTTFTIPSWATHARVSATVQWAVGNAGWRALGFWLNGSEPVGSGFVRGQSANGTGSQFNFISAIVPVTAGDQIKVVSFQATSNGLQLIAGVNGRNCWAQIELFESM